MRDAESSESRSLKDWQPILFGKELSFLFVLQGLCFVYFLFD